MGLREPASGKPACERDNQSPLSRGVSNQRGGGEHAGVWHGVRVQARTTNGETL